MSRPDSFQQELLELYGPDPEVGGNVAGHQERNDVRLVWDQVVPAEGDLLLPEVVEMNYRFIGNPHREDFTLYVDKPVRYWVVMRPLPPPTDPFQVFCDSNVDLKAYEDLYEFSLMESESTGLTVSCYRYVPR